MTTIRWLAATVTLVLVAGCGPTAANIPTPSISPTASGTGTPSTSTTPSSTPSPTQALSKDQQAALDALNRANTVYSKIGANPAGYTSKQIRAMLKKVATGKMLTNMAGWMVKLKAKGYRESGATKVLEVTVGKVRKSNGLRVVITSCIDQRDLVVVDSTGAKAPASFQSPEWQTQEAAMRKAAGSKSWLYAGTRPLSTKVCGP